MSIELVCFGFFRQSGINILEKKYYQSRK